MTSAAAPPRAVWTPAPEAAAGSTMGAFARWLQAASGLEVADYDELWRWSVRDLDGFWRGIWDYFALGTPVAAGRALAEDVMPGAVWFPDARVNFAAHLLRPRADEDAVAVVSVAETGPARTLSWARLRGEVAALAATMRGLGVTQGDVVAGYLPNVPEAITGFLATVSLGAIWSAVGQDYAARAA
jgi:acetoacetyl-CoA synthetase